MLLTARSFSLPRVRYNLNHPPTPTHPFTPLPLRLPCYAARQLAHSRVPSLRLTSFHFPEDPPYPHPSKPPHPFHPTCMSRNPHFIRAEVQFFVWCIAARQTVPIPTFSSCRASAPRNPAIISMKTSAPTSAMSGFPALDLIGEQANT